MVDAPGVLIDSPEVNPFADIIWNPVQLSSMSARDRGDGDRPLQRTPHDVVGQGGASIAHCRGDWYAGAHIEQRVRST
jgi:hypothetical protein